MIENTRDNKTSLLSVGEQIEMIRIKSIYMDRVVLETEGQEWELR